VRLRGRTAGRRLAGVLLCAAATGLAAGCGDDESDDTTAAQPTQPTTAATEPREEEGRKLARSRGGPRTSTYTSGLDTPWALAFLPGGGALVTERPGRVRVLARGGDLRGEPAARIQVAATGEGGLLGIALDPDFEQNRFVYLYATTDSGNQVSRYRYRDGRLARDATILSGIQAAAIHDGGRIHFGPDDRLYITSGEAGQDSLSQDEGSLNGKFLRLSRGQYRGDSPARPEIYASGLRNPQGFDWQPRSERLVATDHGPDGDDEVNIIRRGRNYGWPEARGEDHGGFTAPIAVYAQSIAPSGATFVHLPESAWTGDFLIGALVGEQIRKLSFDGTRVTGNEALFQGEFGRIRTVVEGPDGALYALTSNRDGRGSPRSGDDRIVRIVPPAG